MRSSAFLYQTTRLLSQPIQTFPACISPPSLGWHDLVKRRFTLNNGEHRFGVLPPQEAGDGADGVQVLCFP